MKNNPTTEFNVFAIGKVYLIALIPLIAVYFLTGGTLAPSCGGLQIPSDAYDHCLNQQIIHPLMNGALALFISVLVIMLAGAWLYCKKNVKDFHRQGLLKKTKTVCNTCL
ncbi:MAG: hypothetical protein WC505_01505 [Patescibacteria group bacterium]